MFWNKDTDIDVDQLIEQLTIDEGKVLEIYHDHLGLPTVGIGHLILDSDEESGQALGTKITEERCVELFESDLESVNADCKILHEGWDGYPQEVKQVIANMMFNLGRPRLSAFKQMKAAVDDHNWIEAAIQMEDSKWARQVPNRANRLCDRMRNIGFVT